MDNRTVPERGSTAYKDWLQTTFFAGATKRPAPLFTLGEDVHLHTQLTKAFATKRAEPPAQLKALQAVESARTPDAMRQQGHRISVMGLRYPEQKQFNGLWCKHMFATFMQAPHAHWKDCKFDVSDFHWADLESNHMQHCRFSGSNLHRANMQGIRAENCEFDYANFNYANVQSSQFTSNDATLSDKRKYGCDFARAVFHATDARGAQFIGTQGHPINFEEAKFEGHADFTRAQFDHCNFHGCNITPYGSLFKGATFSHCEIPATMRVILKSQGATLDDCTTAGRNYGSGYEAWSPPSPGSPRPATGELGAMQQAMLKGDTGAVGRARRRHEDHSNHRNQGVTPEDIARAVELGEVASLEDWRKRLLSTSDNGKNDPPRRA